MNTREFTSFEKKLWLSSPTMHGEEFQYMKEAYDTNWSIDGELILNIDGSEKSYEDGIAAQDAIDPAVIYAIQKIGVKDGKVCVVVHDQADNIAQQNKAWINEQKEKTGVEPSFF